MVVLSEAPTPLLAADVQRAGMPGQPDGLYADTVPATPAIVDFSARLSACPPAATAADIAALHAAGMTDAEIFDLILSVAVFGWANRLMHTLGEPLRAAA